MATADQLKSLIRSHFSLEAERFYTIALQVAAHEAKQGHSALANDIREIIDTERKKSSSQTTHFQQDLKGLILTENHKLSVNSMVMPIDLQDRIKLVIHEYRQQEKLKAFGMTHRRKLLLLGPPGTGKTMTARCLAREIGLPLYTIQVDRLVTKFMGETSAKLRQIFDIMSLDKGVYFFDEFDAIGSERSLDSDVGEMRRVLNAFLQFIEQDVSDSFIFAATNHPKLLDQALFRRFDDVFYYSYPNEELRKQLIANALTSFIDENFSWQDVLIHSLGLSHAEIYQACCDAMKRAILSNQTKVLDQSLVEALRNRQIVRLEIGGEI
jgi:SpoVK/Ycf46/Vps4 family AAA+-type ATPase